MLRFIITGFLVLLLSRAHTQQLFEIDAGNASNGFMKIGSIFSYLTITDDKINVWDTDGSPDRLWLNNNGGDIYLSKFESGRVSIGGVVPSTRLHVYKNQGEILRLNYGAYKHGFMSFWEGGGSKRTGWLGFPNDGSDDLYFTNENTGSIVLYNDPEYIELTPDGRLFASGLRFIGDKKNMQYNSSTGEIGYDNSSRRYKTNIQTLEDNWAKILDTRPVKYTRPNSPEYWEYGYIAEEVDSIGLTNLVGYDPKGIPDDVKYDRMVIYLTELVKIQNKRIETLEQDILELKAKEKEQ